MAAIARGTDAPNLLLAVATAATAAIATTTTASATALRAFFRFVDLDGTPIECFPVELRYGCAGSLVGAHGDEGEATGLTRLAIDGHAHFPDLTDG